MDRELSCASLTPIITLLQCKAISDHRHSCIKQELTSTRTWGGMRVGACCFEGSDITACMRAVLDGDTASSCYLANSQFENCKASCQAGNSDYLWLHTAALSKLQYSVVQTEYFQFTTCMCSGQFTYALELA